MAFISDNGQYTLIECTGTYTVQIFGFKMSVFSCLICITSSITTSPRDFCNSTCFPGSGLKERLRRIFSFIYKFSLSPSKQESSINYCSSAGTDSLLETILDKNIWPRPRLVNDWLQCHGWDVILYTVQKVIKFPRYNTKCRGKGYTARNIPRSISFSPLHFVLYLGKSITSRFSKANKLSEANFGLCLKSH